MSLRAYLTTYVNFCWVIGQFLSSAMVWAVQKLCGASSFTGYSTYFFEQAGLDVSSAFSMSLGQYGLGAVGTVLSWFFLLRARSGVLAP